MWSDREHPRAEKPPCAGCRSHTDRSGSHRPQSTLESPRAASSNKSDLDDLCLGHFGTSASMPAMVQVAMVVGRPGPAPPSGRERSTYVYERWPRWTGNDSPDRLVCVGMLKVLLLSFGQQMRSSLHEVRALPMVRLDRVQAEDDE